MISKTNLAVVFRPDVNDEFGWFFLRDDAEYLHEVEKAIASAKTVGEFRAMLPVGEFESFSSWDRNEDGLIYFDGEKYLFSEEGVLSEVPKDHEYPEESIVRADDPLDLEKVIPGFSDGNYPPFFEAQQEDFLPEDFCKQYGKYDGSPAVGAWWEFPVDKAKEMKIELESRGFSVSLELDYKWPGAAPVGEPIDWQRLLREIADEG